MAFIEIRHIETAQTYPLRGAILRPGHPPSESVFPDDDAPETFHLGAFIDEKLLGVATFFPETASFAPQLRAYRLRGMAVAEAAQGSGLGRALIEAAVRQLEARGAEVLWCNARTSASGFYRNLGFETVSDEFEIPGIGPHFVMQKPLENSR
jgi:predicted GNAT family N-acyltransferase